MQRIDAQVAPLEELPDAVRHIRALISRFRLADPLLRL